jgi:putative flavoprotein involved in K+ transport
MVYLAVGHHTRMPRRYRGRDIFWWLDQIGVLNRRVDEVRAGTDARREPSMQLIGRRDGDGVDLPTLAAAGVVLAGHLTSLDDATASFADDLDSTMWAAEQRLCRVLRRIDQHIAAHHRPERALPPELPARHKPVASLRRVDLRRAGVSTVIWATGHRRGYSWLDVPVVGTDGELTHRHGITPVPGLYVLGQRFQRTRRSNFLDGVGADAAVITRHLLARPRPTRFP